MNKKKGPSRKGGCVSFFGFLCVIVSALLLSPGTTRPVLAGVVIDNIRTLGVDLTSETQAGENTTNATVTSTGSVVVSETYAIRGGSEGWNVNVESGGSVTNSKSGSGNSAILFNTLGDGIGTALQGTVTNSGDITSSGTGIKMGGGTVTNNQTGTITGTNNAIDATGTITITNIGSIESTAGDAIHQNAGTASTVVNNTGTIKATVSGTEKTAIYIKGIGTVENTGQITSNEGKGIYFKTSGVENKVVNKEGGTISGGTYGVISEHELRVENSGTITSNGTGIDTRGGGTVTNSGTIAGNGSNGIAAYGETNTVTNTGNISGYVNGIYSGGYTTVDNYGSIKGDMESGVYLNQGKVTNRAGAKITLTDRGVYSSAILFSGDGEVENSGEIEGTGGIHIGKNGKVTNNAGGSIMGTGQWWGIIFGNSGTLINHGTIEGTTGVAFNYHNSDGTENINDTLTNSGTIIGTGGTAVDMNVGDDTANLLSGSSIKGNVDGGVGTDTVSLTGSGTITNGTLLNFETIEKSGTGTFTLGGGLSSGDHISVLGGVIRADGAFTHEAGATYTVGAGADGNLGKISAETATIKGGTVALDTVIGARGGTHSIVGTDSGLTGIYDLFSASTDSDYITAALSYDAKNAYITLSSNFAGAALTENQQAVATSLDETYSTASGDMLNIYGAISTLTAPAIRLAYDQMGGASHTAFAAIDVYRVASFYRNLFRSTPSSPTGTSVTGTYLPALFAANTAVTSDAVSVPSAKTEGRRDGPFSLWIRGYGASGVRDGDDIASRYDFTIGGTVAGIEYRVGPAIRAGAAFGYSRTSVDMKDLQDSGSEDSYQGSLYGSFTSTDKRWYVNTALGYSLNKYNMKRSLSFGTISRTARGSYEGSDISGYAESGYLLPFKAVSITPYVSFLALDSRREGFTESGADALNLNGDSARTTSLQGSLGIGLAKEFVINKTFFLVPEVSARWVHEFGDTKAVLDARFAGAPSGSFRVSSDTWDRDSGVFSLGLTGRAGDAWNFFFAYDARVRSKEFAHAVTGGVRLRW